MSDAPQFDPGAGRGPRRKRLGVFLDWMKTYGAAGLLLSLGAVWAFSAKDVKTQATIADVRVDHAYWSDKAGFAVFLQLAVRDDDDRVRLLDLWRRAPDTRNYLDESLAQQVAETFVRGDTVQVYCTSNWGTPHCSFQPEGAAEDYIVAAIFATMGFAVLLVGWRRRERRKKV